MVDFRGHRQSENIEDRRGMGGGFGRGGFGLGRSPFGMGRGPFGGGFGGFGRRGMSIGTVVIFLLIWAAVEVLGNLGGGTPDSAQRPAQEEELKGFVSTVLASTEDAWHEIFRERGARYEEPKLVLFSGAVESGCGFAESAMGPFYCPADRRVYIDLSFLADLKTRFGAPGDFAQAYVIAHEVGHHVQNITGELRRDERSNAASVRTELKADCLAGVWANRANAKSKILEPGDVEEGLGAAAAVGDDRLQKRSQGYVVPESFTHGSSAQRVAAFKRGLESGNVSACDTTAN
jgi:predicted metalloprotease